MEFRYLRLYNIGLLCILLIFIGYAAIEFLNKTCSLRRAPSIKLEEISTALQISYKNPRVRQIAAQYSISPAACPKDQEFLVIIVAFSRPSGFGLRQTIRKTWGSLANPFCGVRMLFMLGRVQSASLQARLIREAAVYGDIIQSNQFDDIYRSAAQKGLHLLQWGATFCSQSAFIAKIDDDNWLNLPRYMKYLKDFKGQDIVHGAVFGGGSPVWREAGSKYYAPREEYPEDLYTEYLSGMLYAFPTHVIGRVLEASKHVPRTFNDDVFVTGVATTAANLTRRPVPAYAWSHHEDIRNCPKCEAMCIHYSDIAAFHNLWNDPCCLYEELC